MVLLSEQQMHFVIGFNYNYDFVCFSGVFQVFFKHTNKQSERNFSMNYMVYFVY